MRTRLILLLAFFLPYQTVWAELCASSNINISSTTPTSVFVKGADVNNQDQNAEVVIDQRTNLMWTRCQIGYVWDAFSQECIYDSTAIKQWKEALEFVVNNTTSDNPYLGYADWRLPNIKELGSIVERKCVGPAINNEVFPGTSSNNFWTNSHKNSSIYNVNPNDYVWVINFDTGKASTTSKDNSASMRLVRDVTP